MDLKIKDVAELLSVSESTIRRWISEGKIPSYRINHHHLFSRTEIENWVISGRLRKSGDGTSPFMQHHNKGAMPSSQLAIPVNSGNTQFSLFRAIHKGDVLHIERSPSKEDLIRTTMHKCAKLLNVDAEVMIDLLLDRENLMPTGLGHGIAVPHTRDSLLSRYQDAVIVVFLKDPINYGSLDGEPVHTLFFLFACEDKRHLHLLAKIAHLSNQPDALDFLKPAQQRKNSFLLLKIGKAKSTNRLNNFCEAISKFGF